MNEIPAATLRKTWNIYTAMYRIEKKVVSTAWGIWGGNYGKLYPEHIQSYSPIDIWMSLNTKTGVTTYSFWWKGKTYERTNPSQIINLARKLEKQR